VIRIPLPTPASAFSAIALLPIVAVYALDAGAAAWSRPAGLVPDAASYAWSAVIALLIGCLATLLGLALAFASGGSTARLSLLAFVPLATPAFLASTGYGMLRNQTWRPGAWLAELAQEGHPWVIAAVDRSLAVVGLSFWAAPIAALIVAPSATAARERLDDPLRIDAGGFSRRLVLLSTLGAAPWLAVLGVGVLMMGSAVPLHLARVPTAAVELWAAQDLSPLDGRGAVWLSAWPLAAAALLAGGVITSRLMNSPAAGWGAEMSRGSTPGSSALTRLGVLLVVLLGTVVPLGFFVSAIEHGGFGGAVAAFFRVHGEALMSSVVVALATGACVTLLALWTAHAAADASGRTLALAASGWIGIALLPGMLVGALTARVWGLLPGPSWTTDAGSMLHAHLLRLGALGVFAGLVFAAAEPSDRRDSRRLDGARTFLNWWRGSGSASPEWWVGTFLAAWMLSLNEIEAAVVVQPPGIPSLARKILGDLHFYRTQEMAIAVLVQLAMVVLVCGATGWLIGRGASERRPG